jgi:imidazole glycerol phosphate synthase glutamine amidotransferase subunit
VTDVAIVPTGTANTASVIAAFQRLGAAVSQVRAAEEVETAPFLVVPGVGSFGAAIGQIEALGLKEAIRERIEADRPTLAVCVGMQLLANESEESPEARGLGVVGAPVRRFVGEIRVPQLGWNQVMPSPKSRFVEPGWAYFANSYRIQPPPEGWLAATTEYGGSFVSAMERGRVLACQFHPELSGRWGAALLRRWMTQEMVAA